ncbi:MAG: DUF2007 domain-containing protein [Hyphomonadaceae bacterium]|nr:DUF2007 domain-containing protein [Hyphomonadaceae bacterium]
MEYREIRRSNDLAYLSFVQAALCAEGMEPVLLDAHQSVIDGSIGAVQRRLMVAAEQWEQALALLGELEAGLGLR